MKLKSTLYAAAIAGAAMLSSCVIEPVRPRPVVVERPVYYDRPAPGRTVIIDRPVYPPPVVVERPVYGRQVIVEHGGWEHRH